MVVHLAEQLEVPLRERNRLLLAAGYAPQSQPGRWTIQQLSPIRDALGRVLAGHEPYPAIAVDRTWNLVASNSALDPLLSAWLRSCWRHRSTAPDWPFTPTVWRRGSSISASGVGTSCIDSAVGRGTGTRAFRSSTRSFSATPGPIPLTTARLRRDHG